MFSGVKFPELKDPDHKRVVEVANKLADRLICTQGLRLSLPIAKSVFEKVLASYKRTEQAHGKVE
jgi:hypothetical protein